MERTNASHAIRKAGAMAALLVIAILCGSQCGFAERDTAVLNLEPLPVGVTLPVQLSRTLRAGKVRIGTTIILKTTQRVPVGQHLYLQGNAELRGEVIESDAGDGTSARPATLALRFTSLRYHHQNVAVMTKAIAIANFTEVADTFLPATGGPDRGNASPASWTTAQVGGDEVYRSGWIGDVCDSVMRKVGYADYYGVYSLPAKQTTNDGPTLPRAMGVFSTTAAGLYGFDANSTLSSAAGVVTIVGGSKNLIVRNGDNLLLEVIALPRE